MSNSYQYEKPCTYQLRVKGNFTREWSSWFEGFRIDPQPEDETLLTGPVMDQAALHGLLAKIARIGVPLIEVRRLENAQEIPGFSTPEEGEKHDE